MVVVVCAFGAVLYGVELPTSTLPGGRRVRARRDVLARRARLRGRGLVPSENAAPPDGQRDRAPAGVHLGHLRAVGADPGLDEHASRACSRSSRCSTRCWTAFDPLTTGDRGRLGLARGRRRPGAWPALRRGAAAASAGRPARLNCDSLLAMAYRPTERTRARAAAARERIVARRARPARRGRLRVGLDGRRRAPRRRGHRQRVPPLPLQGRPVRRGVPARLAARGRRAGGDRAPHDAGARSGSPPGWRRSCTARWPSRSAPTR